MTRSLNTSLIVLLVSVATASGPVRADDGLAFFETKIRPILHEHCYRCHSAEAKELKAGLRLDSAAGMLAGGESGPAVVRGDEEAGLLLKVLAWKGEPYDMPPDGKLPEGVIDDFRRWIELGAPMPADDPAASPAKVERVIDIEQGRKFWSFQPIGRRPLPATSQPAWSRDRIDRFILNRLEGAKLTPAPDADRRTLLRRLSFDLLGLPPTPQQLRRFEADRSPDAWERQVDRMLASPLYGERWGRRWLDLARYAEDHATLEATCKPPRFPWHYRDWVIDALNADLPYDTFVKRQLAADQLDGLPPAEIAATGFLGLSPKYHIEPRLDTALQQVVLADAWDERVDAISRTFLGLTVACARCHDHKFDPITTKDYYALAGVMASTQLLEWPMTEVPEAQAEQLSLNRLRIAELFTRLNSVDEAIRGHTELGLDTTDLQRQLDAYKAEKAELEAADPIPGPIAEAVRDARVVFDSTDPGWNVIRYRGGEVTDLPVYIRGNPATPGPIVRRRFLEVLDADGTPEPFQRGSGRAELAEAIFSDAKALSARVIVNRVWGWHVGRALVATPSNFGALGDLPSHPDLLDDLAAGFVEAGWSLKWLHRRILLSAAYRQSSRRSDLAEAQPDPLAVDPDNRLLWRMHRRRLEPEAIRDAMLAATGQLELKFGGPSFDLNQHRMVRRSVYGMVSRRLQATVLTLFDFPDARRHAAQRSRTTTPLQQLYLLNSPMLLHCGAELAQQTRSLGGGPDRIAELFRRTLLRPPGRQEADAAHRLLHSPRRGSEDAWALLAQGLLASNEFLFVD